MRGGKSKKGATIARGSFSVLFVLLLLNSLVGRAGFEPATNGLKVAGSEYENLNIQRLATLAKLDSQRHSRVRIDSCRIACHKGVTRSLGSADSQHSGSVRLSRREKRGFNLVVEELYNPRAVGGCVASKQWLLALTRYDVLPAD